MTGKSEKKDKKAEEQNAAIEELQKKLEEAEGKAGEYLQMAQRLQADFDNFRKRTQRENEEYKTFATASLLSEMLNIVDDLDRALASVKEENDLAIGVRGVRQNMMKALEAKGLAEIPTDGKFDPNCHEALCVVEAETDGDIAEVFQKGYRIGNKVLRYSKVKVTKKKEETTMDGE